MVQISTEVMKYLKDMIKYETKFTYDKEGKIVEEKKIAGDFELTGFE